MTARSAKTPPVVRVRHIWNHPIFEGKADAARVNVELEAIRAGQENEDLMPGAVLDYARRNPHSEVHRLFEWDDAKAAEAHRLNTARQIIRSIRVVYEEGDQVSEPRRIYVRPATEGGYKPIGSLKRDAMLSVKKRALADLVNWARRYEDILGQLPLAKTALDGLISLMRQDIEERS